MSADAKVWAGDEGDWHAIHDGECHITHDGSPYDLSRLLADIEACMGGRALRWAFRVYPDGKVGLVGYHA